MGGRDGRLEPKMTDDDMIRRPDQFKNPQHIAEAV